MGASPLLAAPAKMNVLFFAVDDLNNHAAGSQGGRDWGI